MSIDLVYGIYDEASEAYVMPLHFSNEKLAKITVESAFKHQGFKIPNIYDYPDYFKLYQLATFDNNTGVYAPLDVPRLIMSFDTISIKSEV